MTLRDLGGPTYDGGTVFTADAEIPLRAGDDTITAHVTRVEITDIRSTDPTTPTQYTITCYDDEGEIVTTAELSQEELANADASTSGTLPDAESNWLHPA